MSKFVRGSLPAVGRTTMAHPDHDLKITLYPVFHIGSPAFYATLSDDLRRFRLFLLEGVRFRGRRPLYDLIARNLGVVTQRSHLRLPEGSECLSLDMTEAEFKREVRELPIQWYLVLWFLRPLLWAFTATASGRDAMWRSFGARRRSRANDDAEEPLTTLIKTKRDRVMSELLRKFACDEQRIKAAVPAAVIVGASHAPVLYATLRACGYRKGNVRWFEVLEGLDIPAKGMDGQARDGAAHG
jgi:hypothetical protein